MAALSNYAENKVLDHLVGKTAFTMPTVSIALYTTAPTDSTSGTEVSTSGTAYARKATAGADWNAASGGSISNANAFEWSTATAAWGTVVAAALVDGSGNILAYGTAAASKVIDTGDTYRIPAGSLTLTLD